MTFGVVDGSVPDATSARSPDRRARLAALGGVIGPAAFVGAWTAGGLVASGYSAIEDPISRLAAVDAGTRPLMTAGFVVFGIGLPTYAWAWRRVVGGAAWTAAAAGIATLAVAAIPLGRSSATDSWHGVVAGIGYVTLAATPLLATRPLWRSGHRALARLGAVAGTISAVSLLLSSSSLPTGLFQRLGLTASDIWIVSSALGMSAGTLPARASG